ncbi:MAG: hypothetical protein LBT30_07985 [Clostridiales bacterium]|jgi:hypothetical protein|nr:hypothetical protein [Clostridiales bacterium]
MEFVETLKNIYGFNEPILIDEIKKVLNDYSEPRIFQLLKAAVEQGELAKCDSGIYYFSTETILGKSVLSLYDVIEKKYLKENGRTIGFYTGWGLLNAIGGTRQMTNTLEIVTNKTKTRVREINFGKSKFILRKSRCEIDDGNEKILKILELGNRFTCFDKDVSAAILNYAKRYKITTKDILKYAGFYPTKAIKNISGVLYELA